jgi:hypothetical protein
MPVNDWTRVDAEIFHDFHLVWAAALQTRLNDGLLPQGYYALVEQHVGRAIADVFTLHTSAERPDVGRMPPDSGGIALDVTPPRVSRTQSVEFAPLARRRSLTIRHVSGHRLVALIEIMSPAIKDRSSRLEAIVDKAVSALQLCVQLLLVDLFPPGPRDPSGIHGLILQRLEPSGEPYALPDGSPLTVASYLAGPPVDIYLEHFAVGAFLTEMPLFLQPDRYVNVPLESTYQASYRGMPAFWRDVLEGRPALDS